jgi:cell division protein FtsA
MISRTKFVAAVEIGTFKVSVLIGQFARGRSLHIIGFGECPSRGVVKGMVVDFKAASECVHSALEQAERSAGARIDEVYLAQSGAHLDGFQNQAGVTVSSADNMVSALDLDNVCRLAKAKHLPDGRMVVHNIRRPYRLDGELVPDPEHRTGRRLEVAYWTVHGQEARIADHIHVIQGFNVKVTELILSSLASGTMMTTIGDRHNGALVIDLGAGTTDFVLYRDGCVQMTGVLPIGGGHLTNDLALGLRQLGEEQAERLKVRFGRGLVATRDRADKVWLNGDFAIGDKQFPRMAIEQITAARTWEIFEVVRKKLGAAFTPETSPAGVILTGGASRLAGIDEAAAKVFGVQARLGEPPDWVGENLRAPGFSAVLGLLHYGLSGLAAADGAVPAPRSGARNFFQKLFPVRA